MLRTFLQALAFPLPSPCNLWLHRLAGAKVGRGAHLHPFVLILARKVVIARKARIRFGTLIRVREFAIGQNSSIGYFTLVKGERDLLIGDACLIGPRSTIDCTRTVRFGYYASLGPRSILYTHGSFLPVTWGYPARFAEVTIEDRVWVSMNVTIGPGVRIGHDCLIMPGAVILDPVPPDRMVLGSSPALKMMPIGMLYQPPADLAALGPGILDGFASWVEEMGAATVVERGALLRVRRGRATRSIGLGPEADIRICTTSGETGRRFFMNLADLTTDPASCSIKDLLERYLRMYYGLILREE